MILIISESKDFSTLEVSYLLNLYKIKFVRINSDDHILIKEINLNTGKLVFSVGNIDIDISEITKIWYRRGFIRFYEKLNNSAINLFQQRETKILNQFIFNFLLRNKQIKCLGNYLTSEPNKLQVLEYARDVGLLVPKTYISGIKKNTLKILGKLDKVITKGIGSTLAFTEDELFYMGYTELINHADLQDFDHSFFPSLLQEGIEKKIEIRAFILKNKIYAMAIFSQKNTQTLSDFRKYDFAHPNRTVPFRLPKKIEKKILLLMKRLKLNTASIDMIADTKGDYIFLEINPIGQFGMVSKPCRYNLENKIAKFLSK